MAGNKAGIVLQPRDLLLLRHLGTVRVIDRQDARVLCRFRSRTRANARLLQLFNGGLLLRKAAGTVKGGHKFLYALSTKGARLLDVPPRTPPWNPHATLAWSESLEHQLMITRVYVALTRHEQDGLLSLLGWTTFSQPISRTIPLKPDAYIELQTKDNAVAWFLEVDRGTETLGVWREKVRLYLALASTGEFRTRFTRPRFRVAVIAPSPRRLETVRASIAKQTDKLFWLASPASGDRDWLTQPVWLRPHGDAPQSIF